MPYAVRILRRAQRELAGLPPREYRRIRDVLFELANEPRPTSSRKLTGRTGWRVRIGDYRVIYDIEDNDRTVTVVHVGHRQDVYR